MFSTTEYIYGLATAVFVAQHPHRHQEPEDEEQEDADSAEDSVYSYNLSPAKTRAIAASIRKVVETQEAFLERHLTVQDSLEIVGINGIPVTILFNNP